MGDIWWKSTFDGRWTLMGDDLWWEMTFDVRHPLMEDNLGCKMTSDGRRPLIELRFPQDDLWLNRDSPSKAVSAFERVKICKNCQLSSLFCVQPKLCNSKVRTHVQETMQHVSMKLRSSWTEDLELIQTITPAQPWKKPPLERRCQGLANAPRGGFGHNYMNPAVAKWSDEGSWK